MKTLYFCGTLVLLFGALSYHLASSYITEQKAMDCVHLSQDLTSYLVKGFGATARVVKHTQVLKGDKCYYDIWYDDDLGRFDEQIYNAYTNESIIQCYNALAEKPPFPEDCKKYNKLEGEIF